MSLTEMTRPIGSLANARVVVGMLLIAVAVGSGFVLSGGGDSSIAVLAAARDLAVSAPLSLEDFTTVSVTVPESSRGHLIPASEAAIAAGLHPLRPLKAGELVTRGAFSKSPAPFQEVAVTIPPGAPLDARLVAGDRVDVVATLGKGSIDARTVVLARGAEVVEFSTDDDSSSLTSASSQQVVVGVKPVEALAVVYAMHNGDLALIRAAASSLTLPLPAEVNSENLGGGQ